MKVTITYRHFRRLERKAAQEGRSIKEVLNECYRLQKEKELRRLGCLFSVFCEPASSVWKPVSPKSSISCQEDE